MRVDIYFALSAIATFFERVGIDDLILLIGSLVCGCSGSTSGGIKIDRVWQALKGCSEMFRSLTDPSKYNYVRVEERSKSEAEIASVMSFIVFYLLITGLGAVVYLLGGLDFHTGFSASIACMGNVGPGFGDVGSMANYAELPAILKYTGLTEMLIGRLEIFPLLYLFQSVRGTWTPYPSL